MNYDALKSRVGNLQFELSQTQGQLRQVENQLIRTENQLETRKLVDKVTAVLFEFANQIATGDGIYTQMENGEQVLIPIDGLFVSDLKMLPIVFGVNHSSCTNFCPLCHIERQEPTIGEIWSWMAMHRS